MERPGRHRREAWLLAALLLSAVASPAGAAEPPDGLALTVDHGPGAGEVMLSWKGGQAHATEGAGCTASIEHQVRLSVPVGVDYDLYVHSACGALIGSSTLSSRLAESVTVCRQDSLSTNDSFDYWVEIRWVGGASCSNRTLELYGH